MQPSTQSRPEFYFGGAATLSRPEYLSTQLLMAFLDRPSSAMRWRAVLVRSSLACKVPWGLATRPALARAAPLSLVRSTSLLSAKLLRQYEEQCWNVPALRMAVAGTVLGAIISSSEQS